MREAPPQCFSLSVISSAINNPSTPTSPSVQSSPSNYSTVTNSVLATTLAHWCVRQRWRCFWQHKHQTFISNETSTLPHHRHTHSLSTSTITSIHPLSVIYSSNINNHNTVTQLHLKLLYRQYIEHLISNNTTIPYSNSYHGYSYYGYLEVPLWWKYTRSHGRCHSV